MAFSHGHGGKRQRCSSLDFNVWKSCQIHNRANRTFFEPAGKLGPVVVAAMLKRGVIARAMPEGDIIGFAPPLCLSEDEADTIVKVTKEAVEEACAAI